MDAKTLQINRAPDILQNIISNEKLQSIYTTISTIVLGTKINNYEELVCELEKKAILERDDYLRKMRAVTRSIDIKYILDLNCIKEIADRYGIKSPVQFSNPVLHISSKKLTFGSSGVYPHQDWPSTLGSYNSVIVWISLGGAEKQSGGLFFYESKGPVKLLQGSISEHVVSISELELQMYEKKYYSVQTGSALIFGHFLPHSSECENTRLSISLRIEDASDQNWFQRNYEYSQTMKISRKTFKVSEIEEINDRITKT